MGVLGLALLAVGGGLTGCGVRVTPAGSGASGVAATVPTTTSTAVTMPPVECSPEGVRFAVVGEDAAMGLRDVAFEVVNCGTAPHTVSGYPEIRLFDEGHQSVPATVEHGSGTIATVPEFDNPPGEVTLRPGERARSGLLWRNLVTDPDPAKSVTAHYLEVMTGRTWQDMPMVMPDDLQGARQVTVDLGNTGRLGVRAWVRS